MVKEHHPFYTIARDELKLNLYSGLILDLLKHWLVGLSSHSARYLENAAPDMFTAVLNRLQGKTNSLVERVMRTINLRINVGKWSLAGALNVTKVRLAYYYNCFDA